METEPVKFKIQRVKKIHRKKENTTSCYFDQFAMRRRNNLRVIKFNKGNPKDFSLKFSKVDTVANISHLWNVFTKQFYSLQ